MNRDDGVPVGETCIIPYWPCRRKTQVCVPVAYVQLLYLYTSYYNNNNNVCNVFFLLPFPFLSLFFKLC